MREYYYLAAGLPMLEFGMKAPISYGDFSARCERELSRSDAEIIKKASISPSEDTEEGITILREWKRFDRDLRNEIVRMRAAKKAKDPVQYIRGENYPNPFMTDFAQWAVNQDSPIEAETSFDRLRWEKIEELEKGHYFDIEYLITYALRLQILERWERINSGGGMNILQGLLEKEIA